MTRYRIRDEQSAVSIDLTEVGGRRDELLNVFAEPALGNAHARPISSRTSR